MYNWKKLVEYRIQTLTSHDISEILLNLTLPTTLAFLRAIPSCWFVMSRGKPGCHPAPLIRRDAKGAIWKRTISLAKNPTDQAYSLVETAVVVGRVGIIIFATVRSPVLAEEVGPWVGMHNVDLCACSVSHSHIPSAL